MKILITIKSISHFSYVSSVIEHLDNGENEIFLLFDRDWSNRGPVVPLFNFLDNHPNIFASWSQQRRGKYRRLIFTLREIRSYLSYLKRDQSVYYKDRWASYIPKWVKPFGSILKYGLPLFEAFENQVGPAENIQAEICEINPDVVFVTPGNHRFSEVIEYVKAAKFLDIPTVILNYSWDNLTTKGLFHVKPDRLFVWNKSQAQDAINIHGILPESIEVTGAPFFDKWLELDAFTDSKYAFCERVGLNPKLPYFLYMGSSANIAEDEMWLIDNLHAAFDNVGILIRPHPSNYKNFAFLNKENVAVFPPQGQLVENESQKLDFYRSMLHAKFVFGVNTSGMLDAIINDKPCVTLLTQKYRKTQIGASHFKPMMSAMYICNTKQELNKCCIQLIEGKDNMTQKRKKFAEEYIWPMGTPAGKVVADLICARQ